MTPCTEPVIPPVTINEPVIACEPVKYSKLPSNSAMVSAEPFTCLNVKLAILFLFINIKWMLQNILIAHFLKLL